MSVLQNSNFEQNPQLLKIRQQQKALAAQWKKEEEARLRIMKERERQSSIFTRERAVLLDQHRQLKRTLRTEPHDDEELKELLEAQRKQMRMAIQYPRDKRSNGIATEEDRFSRVQQLTEANLYDDEKKRQRVIQQTKQQTRRRILDRIRKSFPGGLQAQISDEQLMKAYENGTLQKLQKKLRGDVFCSTPSSSATSREGSEVPDRKRVIRSPTATNQPGRRSIVSPAGGSTRSDTAASSSDDRGQSRNVVIEFDGTDYELIGVPREKATGMIQIDANRDETNLVYYFYPGDKYQSAVRLPPPKKMRRPGPSPKKREHKAPIRLATTSAPKASSADDSQDDSGLSSIEDMETGENMTAVDFISMLHSISII